MLDFLRFIASACKTAQQLKQAKLLWVNSKPESVCSEEIEINVICSFSFYSFSSHTFKLRKQVIMSSCVFRSMTFTSNFTS